MIVEVRTYKIIDGKIDEYIKRYEDSGLAIQSRILGNLLGYYTCEKEDGDYAVHMWGYPDVKARNRLRDKLANSTEWQQHLQRMRGFVIQKDSVILHPTQFSPQPTLNIVGT
ncbi:MAG: NIPSNAP family protein [Alcaligenaceae bacterium]|nr:NIPSNAP family protein [Alcaligenaceae bacterium]|tara:strand:+ start:49 stop:384 length:336 start_codon:yes stop_codon:yes gene_type:complete